MHAIVTLGNQLLVRELDAPARTVESLGLDGLDADAIRAYATDGGWAPHLA